MLNANISSAQRLYPPGNDVSLPVSPNRNERVNDESILFLLTQSEYCSPSCSLSLVQIHQRDPISKAIYFG